MMFTDVIGEAVTEREVYFLLSAYVEAVRYCDQLGSLPDPVCALPVAGTDDVRKRAEVLGEICRTAVQRDHGERRVTSEALEIFVAAEGRLTALERGKSERLAA
ncbi:MAG TPA: hypothetical protein VMN03_09090 [Burkholderiales bacterium]|nr:hypothetical protein [Burkholderiales bacterium]